MQNLVPFLPVLGCLAMAAVMWVMMRGQHSSTPHAADPATQEEINLLRAEIALLKQDQQQQQTGPADEGAGQAGSRP